MTVVASNYERKENDLYQTEPWATEALLRHLDVRGKTVLEAAAGNHLMVDVLIEAGAKVFASDIKVYDHAHWTLNFLGSADWEQSPIGHEMHITNPPYGKGNRDAVSWARLALKRCDGWVALLLTAKFDSGSTRTDLFRDNPRFAAKIVLLDRIQWFPGETSGTEDHAWYVWRPGPGPRPVIYYEGRETHDGGE